MSLFQPLFRELNEAGVRYVVVGGLAVVLHGYARLTADIDLILDLSPDELRRAIASFETLGFQPRVPVRFAEFADPAIRKQWIEEKGMQVFSLFDVENPMRLVDLFAENPIPFDELWVRSRKVELGDTFVRVASIPDLITLKRRAGRRQDLDDIEQLEAIHGREEPGVE